MDDFDRTVSIFASVGLVPRSSQESRRESWRLDGVEIELDEWPWLDPYIEIEGASEVAVRKMSGRLGFDWADAVFGDVMAAYRVQYPHLNDRDTVGNLKEVKFGTPLPDLLKN